MSDKPTKFSQALADEICRRLICGEYLKDICDEPGMPTAGTVRYWRNQNAVFRAQYEAAREAAAEALFEEMLEIADDKADDWVMTKFGPKFNKEAAARSRIRLDTREFMLKQMAPKRYGDKSQLDLTNSDGRLSTMTDEAKAARLTAIHQAVQERKRKAKEQRAEPEVDDGSDLV